MKTNVLVVYCMVLFALIVEAQSYFRHQFSGVDLLKHKVATLEERVHQEELRAALASYQLEDFKQTVATLMPQASLEQLAPPEAYPLRNLASVAKSAYPGQLNLERASGLLEEGKRFFRETNYEEAVTTFRQLIDEYPNSIHVVESYFLEAESQFQMKEFETCIATIEAMITVFPDNELTGFALLRLGKIYELQDRLEDAVEIYKTVLSSFTDRQLLQQAKISLQAVEL